MGKELTPEFVIQWTRFMTGIIFTWPPRSKTTRLTEIIFETCWWISLIVIVAGTVPLFSTAYKHRTSFNKFTESVSLAFCLIQTLVLVIIAKHHSRRFQYIIDEMETFVKNANSYEREVLTNNVEVVTPFYFRYNILCLTATLAYTCGPFVMDQPFPNIAEYPFPVDKHPLYDMILILEVINGVQCCCTGGFICQLSLLLWYGTIQLRILSDKIEKVSDSEGLENCISIHQYILWYIEQIIEIVQPVIAVIIAIATISIVCGAIQIVGNAILLKKIQLASILIASGFELLSVAWAAENLTAASEGVSWALYNLSWTQNSKKLNGAIIFMIQRCQNPPKIAIGGLMPTLFMEYYAKYISAIYSFFTTPRVMLQKFEQNQ
ncbi:uncharacterized protein LOC114841463 [Diachasma alloeum]|uniref:Odorant receptor n=1 Tax=Diachasma alloeum TaxID=454923 RepID=A0A4E0S3V5_9HYME|nr:uncharacterized protein LOC114841463 [Diachasma alloeum]THK33165.1 odorant receptor 56 [Diachasma alloeum]